MVRFSPFHLLCDPEESPGGRQGRKVAHDNYKMFTIDSISKTNCTCCSGMGVGEGGGGGEWSFLGIQNSLSESLVFFPISAVTVEEWYSLGDNTLCLCT